MALSRTKKIAFTLLLCGGALASMEIVLRLAWSRPPRVPPGEWAARLIVADPSIGWRGRPHQAVSVRFPMGAAEVLVRTNSSGFRDVDHPRPPSGKPRVIVIGDSYTFGFGVSNGEIFTDYLQELLPEAEIINMGISATNTAQQRKLLEMEGLVYQPQLVVLAFCQNDVTSQQVRQLAVSPTNAMDSSWKDVVAEHVYLGDFVRTSVSNSKVLSKPLVAFGLTKPPGGYSALSDNLRPALKEYPKELSRMWEATLAEIGALAKTVAGASARLLVAPVPARETVDPLAFDRALNVVTYRPDDFELNKPYDELRSFCVRNGVPMAATVAQFVREGADLYLPHGEIHFNARGHRRFAEILAPEILRLLGPQETWRRPVRTGDHAGAPGGSAQPASAVTQARGW